MRIGEKGKYILEPEVLKRLIIKSGGSKDDYNTSRGTLKKRKNLIKTILKRGYADMNTLIQLTKQQQALNEKIK